MLRTTRFEEKKKRAADHSAARFRFENTSPTRKRGVSRHPTVTRLELALLRAGKEAIGKGVMPLDCRREAKPNEGSTNRRQLAPIADGTQLVLISAD